MTSASPVRRSAINTSVCLLGCSIGDFGALIWFAIYAPQTALMIQMGVAIVCGISTSIILETLLLRFRESFPWKNALQTAFGMSLISMIAMEIAMNVTDFTITRSLGLTITDVLWWLALLPALAAGFLAAWPYNYWRLVALGKSCCGGET